MCTTSTGLFNTANTYFAYFEIRVSGRYGRNLLQERYLAFGNRLEMEDFESLFRDPASVRKFRPQSQYVREARENEREY